MENIKKPKLVEDLGMRQVTELSIQKKRFGIYECPYCGQEFEAQTPAINSGNTKSCGCLRPKENSKGRPSNQDDISESKIKLYNVYNFMKARCYNESVTQFKDYGGRGIKVCDRWLNNFNSFYVWAITSGYSEGLTLDRVDVNKDYEPDNCRFTSRSTQSQNTREIRISNTSGYRGVSWNKVTNKWISQIWVSNTHQYLGQYSTALDAGKAYERYVRLNNLEHNFTPALTEEEIMQENI